MLHFWLQSSILFCVVLSFFTKELTKTKTLQIRPGSHVRKMLATMFATICDLNMFARVHKDQYLTNMIVNMFGFGWSIIENPNLIPYILWESQAPARRHSIQVGALSDQSYAERMNSAANLLVTKNRTLLDRACIWKLKMRDSIDKRDLKSELRVWMSRRSIG